MNTPLFWGKPMAHTQFSMKSRQLLIISMVLVLGLTTISCGAPVMQEPASESIETQQPVPQAAENRLSDGQYPVQQATYDDGTGEYSVMLLNTAPSDSSVFRTANLAMARLTEEEISSGQSSYLKVDQGQPSLHLTEDFRIEYIHNVTETVTDPQTGQAGTIVVRQEPSFWTPFAGALAGQALGSLLFRPQYYMPPIYQPGVPLVGYGSYGRTYNQAVQGYQTRYQTAPAEVRNRQTFRRTGRLRSPGYSQSPTRRTPSTRDRATGSGYGGDTLRRSNPTRTNRRSPSGFGSSGARRRSGRRR